MTKQTLHSNCIETTLGVKKRNCQDFPAAGLRRTSTFLPGENRAKVVGKKDGVTVEDAVVFGYETRPFGDEAQLSAEVVESTGEYAWIEARLTDQDGVPCLLSANYIYFDAVGDGYLIENRGTSTASGKVQAYNGRAKIKLIKNGSRNIVSVKSDGLEPVFLEVE